MNLSRSIIKSISAVFLRNVSKKRNSPIETFKVRKAFYRLKRTQKRYQVQDGLPIYLKAGLRDQILYQVTLVSVLVGVILSLRVFYDLSFAKHTISWGPKKKQ